MIKVVAKNFVKEEQTELFLERIKELIVETLKEEGCISYELFQDVKDPTIFTMIEEWETMWHLTNHMNSPHFKHVVPTLGELTSKEGEINVYTPVK